MPSTTNIYPNVKAKDWKERVRIAWRILRHGEWFPAPMDWYEPLYWLTSQQYSAAAEKAVEKSELEFAHNESTREIRRKEAIEWMRHYAREMGQSGDIQPWALNFLVEWWVARKKGRF